jgi:NADPH-dependent 2,4-dienoyl-CoA reductase/sulfur reductase-like enzyme
MSILTRRNFLGSVAAADGLAALQKVVGAEGPNRSRSDPGPANPTLVEEDDLVILGGGTGGTVAAWAFANKGHRVAVWTNT